jgi:hypothetical protein
MVIPPQGGVGTPVSDSKLSTFLFTNGRSGDEPALKFNP